MSRKAKKACKIKHVTFTVSFIDESTIVQSYDQTASLIRVYDNINRTITAFNL